MPRHFPPISMDDREFVSVDETRRITGLSRTSIYNLIASGKLATRKVGKRRLVVRRSIASLGHP